MSLDLIVMSVWQIIEMVLIAFWKFMSFCISLLSCKFLSFIVLCVSPLLRASWRVLWELRTSWRALWDFVCLFCSCAGCVELLPLLEEPAFGSSYRFAHDRRLALLPFFEGSCVLSQLCRAFVYTFETEIFHFERSCVCLFTWLLDILDELLLLLLVLILFIW